jgi:arsenate reductase
MAEGLAKEILGDSHDIQSAGSTPSGEVHPNAIIAMDEIGINIRNQFSKSTDDLDKDFINNLDFAITLCAEEVCPVLPFRAKSLHWSNKDPANSSYDEEQLNISFAFVRDNLYELIQIFTIEHS